MEFASDNVILEAWNVALLSSNVGWWCSRGTETVVSDPLQYSLHSGGSSFKNPGLRGSQTLTTL